MSTTRKQLSSLLLEQRLIFTRELNKGLRQNGKTFGDYQKVLRQSDDLKTLQSLEEFMSGLSPGPRICIQALIALEAVIADLDAAKRSTFDMVDTAFRAGFYWGVSSRYRAQRNITVLTPYAAIGKKVSAGGQKGTEKAHGSPELKTAQRAKYAAMDKDLQKRHPSFSKHKRHLLIAEKCGVSYKTVERNLK